MAAFAQNVPVVRDAEIEDLLYDYARPIMKAAGVRSDRIEVVLVNSREFNAFVSGRKIFINVGTIVQSETPNEIIGVLAHEIGHLAGGHQDRLRQQIDRAQTIATVTSVLGVAGAIAAGASGSGEGVKAGAGLASAGVELAKRGLLSYQRSEEIAADRSAITYLNKTGQSSKGLVDSFKRMDRGISLIRDRIDPYRVSHPLPAERVALMETLAKESPHYGKGDPASLQQRHDLARAKILAYVYGPSAAQDKFKGQGLAGLYGNAISNLLYRNPRDAVTMINKVIAQQPNNPYFHEIKGEALLKARDAKGAADAFAKASALDKGQSATIMVALGQALVLAGGEANLRRAVGELEVATSIDPNNPRAYRHLAMAYGGLGDNGNAMLASAEEQFYSGNLREAKQFAARTKRLFAKNDPQWLRADDIERFGR